MPIYHFNKVLHDKNKKFILVNWYKRKSPFGCRNYDELYDKLKTNSLFIFIDFMNYQDIIEFIKSNTSHYLSLIFPMASRCNGNIQYCVEDYKEQINCLKYIKTISHTNMIFYFIPHDPDYTGINNEYLNILYSSLSDTIKLILCHEDLDDIPNNVGRTPAFNNVKHILFYPANYAYKSSFVSFNENPISKIALSGHNCSIAYPTRTMIEGKISKYPNLCERIPANRNEAFPKFKNDSINTFSIKLNKYLANIYTCHYNYKTSVYLLKFFEILASGSLLVMPLDHKKLCDKVNMIENIHYKTINFNNDIEMLNGINYILNPENRGEIDIIRRQGYDFCKEKFNASCNYKRFINLFDQ